MIPSRRDLLKALAGGPLSNSLELSLSADEARMLLTVEDTRGADLMMVEGVR